MDAAAKFYRVLLDLNQLRGWLIDLGFSKELGIESIGGA
jgi:hypothetical protein